MAHELPDIPVCIRSFEPRDAEACRRLYHEGLTGGKIAANDTGVDIDDIRNAYMRHRGSHFWVAEHEESHEIIGCVGVQMYEEVGGEAEIRRLRVRPDSRRRGVGTSLMEAALKFCQERGYLKVVLDTFMDREPATKLFEKFHFSLSRTRDVGGKTLLVFYLDLYQSARPAQKADADPQ